MRRPQRPGNHRTPKRALEDPAWQFTLENRQAPPAQPAMLWQGQQDISLGCEHSAPRACALQGKTRAALCRNCGCLRFLVDKRGNQGRSCCCATCGNRFVYSCFAIALVIPTRSGEIPFCGSWSTLECLLFGNFLKFRKTHGVGGYLAGKGTGKSTLFFQWITEERKHDQLGCRTRVCLGPVL